MPLHDIHGLHNAVLISLKKHCSLCLPVNPSPAVPLRLHTFTAGRTCDSHKFSIHLLCEAPGLAIHSWVYLPISMYYKCISNVLVSLVRPGGTIKQITSPCIHL